MPRTKVSRNGMAFTGKTYTAQYRASALATSGLWHPALQRGFFTYFDIPAMERDPQISFGLQIIGGPIATATWEIEVDNGSSDVEQWIDRTLQRLWEQDLDKVMEMIKWGSAGGEVLWNREDFGYTEYEGLNDVHFNDQRPVTLNGKMVGLKLTTVQDSPILTSPRFFRISNMQRYGSLYGLPRLVGAWEPWMEKRGRHGAVDVRRLWFIKNAFRGAMIRYPLGKIEVAPGVYRSCEEYAREIVEKMETGGVVGLPNSKAAKGDEYLWTLEEPKVNGEPIGIREYPKDLDEEQLMGIGIHPEIVKAATSGSGWSGRSIPFLVFLTSEDRLVQNIIRTVDNQVIKPGVEENFGPEVKYRIKPVSLIPKEMPEEGAKPQSGLTGPISLSIQHAPSGGVKIGGKFFPGGRFIPDDDLAKATPEERAKLEGGAAPNIQGAHELAAKWLISQINKADAEVPKTIKKTRSLFQKLKDGGKALLNKVVGVYKDLEAKHGRAAAIAIFATGHGIGLAVPGLNLVPGSTLLATGAVARVYDYAKRGIHAVGLSETYPSPLTKKQIEALAKELFAAVIAELKEEGLDKVSLSEEGDRSERESASSIVDEIISRGASVGITISDEVRKKVIAAIAKKKMKHRSIS